MVYVRACVERDSLADEASSRNILGLVSAFAESVDFSWSAILHCLVSFVDDRQTNVLSSEGITN